MIRAILPMLLLFLAAAGNAVACDPYGPTVCEAFSRANAVFIGTLTKLDVIPTSPTAPVLAHFTVQRVFKGKVEKEEIIKFGSGDCDPKLTNVGEKYFVYKTDYEPVPMFGNRTAKLNDSAPELEYAESLSWEQPRFEISGNLSGYDKEVLDKAVVTVKAGNFKKVLNVKRDRSYSFTIRQPGIYTIKILLPVEKRGWVKHENSFMEFNGKSIEYSVDFKPNECDHREIEMLDWPQRLNTI